MQKIAFKYDLKKVDKLGEMTGRLMEIVKSSFCTNFGSHTGEYKRNMIHNTCISTYYGYKKTKNMQIYHM